MDKGHTRSTSHGLPDSLATRASLLERLKNWNDYESWRDFRDTYWRLIFQVARNYGLSQEESEDVAQETLKEVAEKIGTFCYDPTVGSFKSWLYRLTKNNIIDQFRERLPRAGTPLDPAAEERFLQAATDPGTGLSAERWDEAWRENLLTAAMTRLKNRLPPRQLQIFDLYETQKWPVGRVAETLGVSRALVYVTRHRVKNLLKREVARLQEELI